MKNTSLLFLTAFLLIGGITLGFAFSDSKDKQSKKALKTNSTEQVANEYFDKMMSVLTHPRCMNCHPAGDRPYQGNDQHVHQFNVQRGPANQGAGALSCNTCHHEENNYQSGVPGAPHWGLAPVSMAWEGLSNPEIARVMLDKSKNGGKDLKEIVKHLTEDKLVLWAFNPGVDHQGIPREKPPLSEAEYVAAVKAWAAAGAVIPAE